MARMIDADRLLRELTALSHGQVWPGWTYDGIRLLIERQPTLTPPNEPLTCEGCLYAPDLPYEVHCRGCARLYTDHYRRPPEGEEDT